MIATRPRATPKYIQQFGTPTANEWHTAVIPPDWKGDGTKRGAILCVAGGQIATTWMRGPPTRLWLDILAQHGIPVAVFDLGATATTLPFGNDAALAKLATAQTYCQTTYGYKTDSILGLGGSMGGATIRNYTKANPTRVKCLALFIPVTDIEDIRANDRLGTQSDVHLAYGGNEASDVGWQAARATHNPVEYAPSISSIPVKQWYSTDDPVCLPEFMLSFAALHTNTTTVSLGATQHLLNTLPPYEVADFLLPHQ